MSDFFKKFGSILRPTRKPVDAGKEPAPEAPQVASARKSVGLGDFGDLGEAKDVIKRCVCNELRIYRGGTGFPDVTVWIDDPIADQLATPDFQSELRTALIRNIGAPKHEASAVTVRMGPPPESVTAVTLSSPRKLNSGKVFLSIAQEVAAVSVVELSIHKSRGSLEVDPFKVEVPDRDRTFRIGRGKQCDKEGYTYRENDIVISTSDPDPEIQDLNNHVSSAHADLVYHEGAFYLKVLPPGTASQGNSTRIVRDQEPISLNNPRAL